MKNSHDNKCKRWSRHLLQHKGFNFLEVTLENWYLLINYLSMDELSTSVKQYMCIGILYVTDTLCSFICE